MSIKIHLMKISLFVLFLFASFSNYSQSLISPNKLWSTMKGPVFGCKSLYCESYFTKFFGDTVIDEIHYLKVLRSDDPQMQKWIFEGFIREDNNQKVYYRDTIAKRECLLYDFGCKVGDTLQLNCVCYETGYKVDSIQTVLVNNIPRKYFYLTYLKNETNEVWIEGIGSNMGILNGGGWGHCAVGGWEALLCCFDTGVKIYQSPESPNYCYLSPEIINGIESRNAIAQFKVYPNPVSGQLFIQSSSIIDELYTLEIYSVKGELLKTECLDPGSNLYRSDTSSLLNGIYILRLISDSGKFDEEVIIKK
jgi:hypothetical protein